MIALSFFILPIIICHIISNLPIVVHNIVADKIINFVKVSSGLARCLSILLLQLGIPLDYVALGVSITLLVDNVITMAIVQILQMEIFAVVRRCCAGIHGQGQRFIYNLFVCTCIA